MWRLRQCPHCKIGDLYQEPMDYNFCCLQCGYIVNHEPVPVIGILKKYGSRYEKQRADSRQARSSAYK